VGNGAELLQIAGSQSLGPLVFVIDG